MHFATTLILPILHLATWVLCHCQKTCPGEFDALSASEFVAAIGPGWNLGNTLDAFPDEGSWNNPPVLERTFEDVKAAGFKSVRIPGMSWTKSGFWNLSPSSIC